MSKVTLLVLAIMAGALIAHAQPKQKLIDIAVVPLNQDWLYKKGERVDFRITVTRNGKLLEGAEVAYEIGMEGLEPAVEGEIQLSNQPLTIKGIALDEPGFVRCEVSVSYQGKKYNSMGAAGVEPEAIKPTVRNPEDFDAFWDAAKAELAMVPVETKLTLQPELCKADYDVYHVEVTSFGKPTWKGKSKIYGMLSVPKKKGKYPAILSVPGAGIRPYFNDDRAAQEVIVLRIGIHGIPVNMEEEVYNALAGGALSGYPIFNMHDKDNYYYKRVYLGCIRAIDLIYALPEFDGENLIVNGGSQGGALSIVTAALDERVKGLAAFYPALSDMTGYLHGRVGGWPHVFRAIDPGYVQLYEHTAGYYDVVNFAKRLKVPGWYSWGYNDPVCPPTTTFAVYNSIQAPKELEVFEETGHWTYPEQWKLSNEWIMEQIGK